jgi:TRAP-type C4-dicarboxylate transport system permease small subunit
MLFAGVALDRSLTGTVPAPGRRALNTVIYTAVFAQIFTFVWVLRRYTTGLSLDIRWAEMLDAPKWQPPLGIVALVVIFSAASVSAAALLKRHINSVDILPAAPTTTEPVALNTTEPVADTTEPVPATRRRLRVSRGQDY